MEAVHVRAMSKLRDGLWGRCKQAGRTSVSPAASLDEALRGVKRDMRELWLRSRYIPDLSGIATFSPSIQPKASKKEQKTALEVPTAKANPPFHVTVQTKPRTHRAQSSVSPCLRVSAPSPVFPTPKPRQVKGYTLKKVPQPLLLHRAYAKPLEKKGELGPLEDFISGGTERNIGFRTEDCPLTALRSYELERKSRDVRAFSSFQLNAEERISPRGFPTAKQSFLTKPVRFLPRPLAAQLPAWNASCLKISKVSPYPSHKKAVSHSVWQFPSIPHLPSDSEDTLTHLS